MSRAAATRPAGRTVPFENIPRYERDLVELAACIRGEMAFPYTKEHDYITQETVLRACGSGRLNSIATFAIGLVHWASPDYRPRECCYAHFREARYCKWDFPVDGVAGQRPAGCAVSRWAGEYTTTWNLSPP